MYVPRKEFTARNPYVCMRVCFTCSSPTLRSRVMISAWFAGLHCGGRQQQEQQQQEKQSEQQRQQQQQQQQQHHHHHHHHQYHHPQQSSSPLTFAMFSWPASCCRLPLYQNNTSSSTRAPLSAPTPHRAHAPAALSFSRVSPPAGFESRGEPAESALLTRLAERASGVVNDSCRRRPPGTGDGRALPPPPVPPSPKAPAPPGGGGGDVSGLDDGFSRRERRGVSDMLSFRRSLTRPTVTTVA